MYGLTNKSADKLIRGFFSLLEEKHYSEITVTELISRSGVSRTTFYRQFEDIFDMYDKVCGLMIDEIMKSIVAAFENDKTGDLSVLIDVLCEKFESQKHYTRLLCGRNGDIKFFEIGVRVAFLYFSVFEKVLSEKELFTLKFVVFSGMGTYVKSILDDEIFDEKNIETYKRILTESQRAGG